MRYILFLIFYFISFSHIKAQRNFTLGDLKTPYSYRVNPAISPTCKFYLSMPLLGFQSIQFTNSAFSLNNLFVSNADDSLILNTSNDFFDRIEKKSYISFESTNQILAFGFKVNDNYFSFDINNRICSEFSFSSDFIRYAITGNGGDLSGKRASFDRLGLFFNDYIEYGLGYSRQLSESISFGGRIKLLSGIANLSAYDTKLGITTNPGNFDLNFDASASIKSATTLNAIDSIFNSKLNFLDILKKSYGFSNLGLGIDFGGSYKLNERITVNASVIDFGFINWKSEIKNYELKPVSYQFSGFDLSNVLKDSSRFMDDFLDTLNLITKTNQSKSSYSTILPTRVYLSGSYKWNDYFSSSVLFYNEFARKSYRPGLVFSSSFSINHWFTTSLNYGIYGGSFSNIGFGLKIRGFFLFTDNLCAFINPYSQKTASINFGFSLVVGNANDQTRSPKP